MVATFASTILGPDSLANRPYWARALTILSVAGENWQSISRAILRELPNDPSMTRPQRYARRYLRKSSPPDAGILRFLLVHNPLIAHEDRGDRWYDLACTLPQCVGRMTYRRHKKREADMGKVIKFPRHARASAGSGRHTARRRKPAATTARPLERPGDPEVGAGCLDRQLQARLKAENPRSSDLVADRRRINVRDLGLNHGCQLKHRLRCEVKSSAQCAGKFGTQCHRMKIGEA